MTDLAIIIVSYNACADLDRCLRALHDDPPLVAHEIVVVDNASGDGSPALVRAAWPGVRVIEAGGNLGFSRANNLGIRATASDLILLLNSDTIPAGAAIDRLVAALRARPDAAIAGPRLVDGDGRPEVSFGRTWSPFNELRQKTLGRLYDAGVPWAASWVSRRTAHPGCPDWVSGACLLVRRADADEVGLLDERFYLYGEDVDFCASVRARGRAVLFTPSAEIVHLRGRSVRQAPASAERLYRISHLAFYEKRHPRWAPWLRAYLRVRGRLPDEAAETKSRA